MSRYLILVLLNIPLIGIALLNTLVTYKMGHISLRRFVLKITFWIIILAGLIFIKNIYTFLFSRGLTQTEPLSLFDVVQITGVIYIFHLVNRLYVKFGLLERKVKDLHQELSIRLTTKK